MIGKRTVLLIVITIALLITAQATITQNDATTYTIGSTVKIKTFWDGVNAYWYISDIKGNVVSYWTFPQVQSYKTTGGGQWQYEVPFSLDSSTVQGKTLIQNYTLASGSKLSVQFEELSNGNVKMTWGIWGAYNRNYRIDFTSNSVPSNKGNLNAVKKIFDFNGNVFYRYDDIQGYAVTNSIDANKNLHQYIEVGNAYQVWKWIDPVIEGGAQATITRTCTGLTNGSWCNLTSAVTAISGTVNFTGLSGGGGSSEFGTSYYSNSLANDTRPYTYSLNVSNSTGTNNATYLYVAGSLNNLTDFTPTGYDGNTWVRLPFWWETNATNNGGVGKVWINLTQNFTRVDVWVGNTTEIWQSNGTNTFKRYCCKSNFEGWTVTQTGAGSVSLDSDGWMVFRGTAVWGQNGIISTDTFTVPYTAEFSAYTTGLTGTYPNWNIGMFNSIGDAPANTGVVAVDDNAGSQRFEPSGVSIGNQIVANRTDKYKFVVRNSTSGVWWKNDTLINEGYDFTSATYNQLHVSMYGNQVYLYVYGLRLRPYTEPEPTWATWGAQTPASGGSTVFVYAIPSGHPMSELKNTSASSVSINLTLTPGTPLQNIQLFSNSSTAFSVTLTINISENITVVSESAQSGFYYSNVTYYPQNTVINATLTFPISNTTFINAPYKGTIALITNDANVTTYSYNSTHINLNSSYVVGGLNNTYNFTIGYNYAPNVTFLNQTFTDNPMPIVFTATDNESNPLNYSIILNGNRTYGTGSPLNVIAMAIGVYNVTLWVNETSASATAQNVSRTAYITKNAGTPVLISPANGSTQTISIVPGSINLAWSNEGTSYNVVVASDSGFVNTVLNTNPTTNYTSVSVFNTGTYYWKVRTLNGSTYGNYSLDGYFIVTQSSLPSGDGTTGIQGIVYATSASGNVLISSANIYIWNSSWSGNTLSGANGYYLFTGLAGGTIYSIRATKEGYDDSLTETVNTTGGSWVTRNILLNTFTSEYIPNEHYVTFIVVRNFFSRTQYIDATVYKGTETIASATGTTDSEGKVTFKLTKTQQYRITFVNSSLAINKEMTIFPSEPQYYVNVISVISNWYTGGQSEAGNINVSVTTSIINSTHAYVNASYVDTLSQTSNLRFHLNQTNASNPLNQTNLQSSNQGSSSNVNVSFIISSYQANSYIVNVYATHTTFGSITRSYGVQFTGLKVYTGIDQDILTWLAVGVLIFLAAFFGATTTTMGAMITTAMGWVFYGFGWLAGLSNNIVGALTLATVVCIIANFSERARKEEFT